MLPWIAYLKSPTTPTTPGLASEVKAPLKLTGAWAPAAGYEVVPTEKALALVAYLQSLRADAPLFEAPFTAPTPAPAAPTAPAK